MAVGLVTGEVVLYERKLNNKGQVDYTREIRLKDLTILQTKVTSLKVLKDSKAFVTVTEDGRIFYCYRVGGLTLAKSKWHFRLGEKGTSKFVKCHIYSKIFRGIDFII
jgi:hypothetical protein